VSCHALTFVESFGDSQQAIGVVKLKISIITATYNAAQHLPALISSLRSQTCNDFEWVVADGGSTDSTLAILSRVNDISLVVDTQPDFGIYDALNRAIQKSSGDYYIVAGCDDVFHEDAVKNFLYHIGKFDPKILSAKVSFEGVIKSKMALPAVFGHAAYIYSHVVSTAFRKDLHDEYGYYSNKYPIAADQFFVLNMCKKGVHVVRADFLAGEVGMAGVSSVDLLGNATEIFRVQVALGRTIFFQSVLMLLRIICAAFRMKKF
jgi:glycosyltransferase involved in cell wall biosynthesis